MALAAVQSSKPRSFDDLEAELLHGQKLQGVLTSNEVQVSRWGCDNLHVNSRMCTPCVR